MKSDVRCIVLAAGLALWPQSGEAQWQAVEKIETYAIEGTSGAELYASIGASGPRIGGLGRAVAYTSFKLTWTRKYEPRNGSCILSVARPKLIITYTLPKPQRKLPSAVRQHWDTFIAGVHAHERVHGDHIKDMVQKIEAATLGLTVPNDPKCRDIKTEMTKRLGALSQAQRQQSRDFDRAELSPGGNVHQLILQLVNSEQK